MPVLSILGAGPHAKVVIATARSAGFDALEVHDDDRARWGATLAGVPIVGAIRDVLDRADATAVIAIGDNQTRHRLAAAARCRFQTLIHRTAHVEPSVTLGDGSVVFAGAVIQPDTVIGAHAIINTSASVDHDCKLGAVVHVAPGARIAGIVSVGDGVLIGVGAVVAPMLAIGAWARVGAGAAVVRDVTPGATVVGVPARPR